MKFITTQNAPKAVGHYSQAVVHNGLVFVSGQLAIDPATGEKKIGTIEEQTELVLKNIAAILEAAGSRKDLVLKSSVFITDVAHFGKVNEIYGKFFGNHKPARATVPSGSLPFGFLVEIEVVAAVAE